MRLDRPLLLLLAALTAGCADPEPFIDQGTMSTVTVTKPKDPVLTDGTVTMCYSDATPWAEVQELGRSACAQHGLQVSTATVTRWQCRVTSPHVALFRCYDPDMLMPDGSPVNPFKEEDVRRWERITGKKAKPHNALTAPGAVSPAAPAPTAPPANSPEAAPPASAPPARAPISAAPPAPAAPPPAAPLSPADIAGRPPMPPPPNLTSPPATNGPAPSQGAYPTHDGFTLPQGSWGDHFQD